LTVVEVARTLPMGRPAIVFHALTLGYG